MMSVVTVTPYPSLGVAAREARSSARAEKRRQSRSLNALRRLGVCIAVVFAVLGAGGGTAQAWPWDVGDQVTAFITNFCGPEDVPQPSLVGGVDNTLGLNKPATSELRGTVIPDTGNAGSKGLGIDRLNVAYNENPMITKPSYERYGFSSLRWTNYGSGCFSVAYWFNPIANFALNLFVHYPMIIGMAVLKFALGTSLYQAFALIITPFISVFTAIFTPWIYFIAPIGVFWAWMRSKGSLQVTLKAAIWVLCIYGVFAWMGNNTSRVVVTMNNFVTEFANGAASKINEVQGGPQVKSSADDPTAAIDQALWHGVPYQTWLLGEVGPDQAKIDQEREKTGQMGWGPAILNGLYIGNDEAGKKVSSAIQTWNSLSYAPEGDGTKTNAWTSDGGKDAWANIPFLYNVKLMCNDDESGSSSTGTGKPEKNRWMYGGSCDAAGAGTQAMVPYFQGKAYDAQLITAFSGGFAALSVTTAVTVSGTYLAIQKMTFFFLLLFSPVFLAISTFADPKRRRFATRYFEIMAANVIKQCVAVCAVLFVANAMSTLLYPPSDVLMPEIPWLLKPFAAFLFFLSMLLLVFPMMSIVKAAAKGDTSVIDKTAAMPSQAGKAVGKTAVVGAAIMATGGFGAGAAGALGGNGQAARMLTQAGRLAGGRGGVGKMLNTTGRVLRMRDSAVSARSQQQGVARAREAGTMAMLSGPGGQEYIARLAKEGMVDTDGNLTKAGFKRAQKDFMKTVDSGVTSARAAQLQDAHMKQYFAGYRAENNGQHHPLDPTSPENKKAAAIAQARERQEISNAALFESKRDQGINKNIDPNAPVAPVDPNAPADPNAPKTEEEAKKASQAAMAAAARERVNGPKFAQDTNIRPNVTATPQDVLATNGITRTEAVEDPTKLLTGDAYEGGDTSKMNPLHPSTAAMNELRFAMLNGTDEDIEKAALKASEAIAAHGVPEEISSVQAVGETAAKFQAADIIGPMPNTATSANWKERAEDASSMQAAIATMPVDHPAGDTVRAYVSALSNPAVDAADVEALKVQAIKALGDAETVAPSQESLFAAGNNPEAATDPALTAGMVAPGATATKTAQAVDVNGVKIAADSSFAQIDRAVETLPEDHPAQASYAAYLQALESGQSTDGQIEAARQNVLADLGGESLANEAAGANVVQGSLLDTPTPLAGPSDSAQPALFDAQGATPDATASVATATPEGFRETVVPSASGDVVRGIEPVMDASASRVDAPQGFVPQTVQAEDGTSREVFIPAAVTTEAPEGFRETSIPTASGETVRGIEPISMDASTPTEAPQGFVPTSITSEDGTQRDIFVPAPVTAPEGFRETAVPTADGDIVRGFEPVVPAPADTTPVEAPQGFVAQTVVTDDGARDIFVPAPVASADTASAPMDSLAAPAEAPAGFREAAVPTESGEVVRGFEPIAADAAVEAPQGFVQQSVRAEDGTSRDIFVPQADVTPAFEQPTIAEMVQPTTVAPEGFRETTVQGVDGETVRGFEPTTAHDAPIEAPQGFVAQSVMTDDGGFRGASVETATGEVVNGFEPMDAHQAAPEGFTPQVVEAADGSQRELFVPSSDQPDTSSASAFVAAPALSFGENGGDVQRDNAPSQPMTQDALFDEGGSVTPEARQSSSFAATEHQAPQEPLFGANDTPAPVAVSMESTRDDISHAVEALPESHPARESFARFEEASASLPSADVEERRQEVLSDLGVTSDGASAVSMVTSNGSDGRDDRSYQQDALFDVADNGSHDQGAHDDQWNPPMGSMNHESIGGVQYGAESMGAPSFAAQDAPVAPLDAPQQPSSWREDVQPLAPATPAIIDDMGQEASAPQPTADYEPSATSSAWGSDYDAPAAGAGDNREFITTPVVAAVPATTSDEPAPSESDNDSSGDDLHQGPSFDPSVGNNDRFIPAGGIRGERADAPSFAAHDDGHSNEADQLGWRGDQRDDYGQRYQADQQPTVIVAEAAGATADHGGYEDRGDTHFTPAYQQVDPDGYGDTRDALYGGQQPQDVRATIDRDDLRMAVREVAEDERRNGRPDQPAPFEARPWADETPRYAEQSGTGFEQASTFEQAPAQQQFDQAPVQQEFHQVDAPAMGQQNLESVSADRGVDLHSADQQRTAATPAASAPQPVIVTGDEDVVEGAPQDVLRVPLAGDENGATEPWRRSRKRRISDFFNPGASNEDGDATTSDETPSVEGGSNESDRS